MTDTPNTAVARYIAASLRKRWERAKKSGHASVQMGLEELEVVVGLLDPPQPAAPMFVGDGPGSQPQEIADGLNDEVTKLAPRRRGASEGKVGK